MSEIIRCTNPFACATPPPTPIDGYHGCPYQSQASPPQQHQTYATLHRMPMDSLATLVAETVASNNTTETVLHCQQDDDSNHIQTSINSVIATATITANPQFEQQQQHSQAVIQARFSQASHHPSPLPAMETLAPPKYYRSHTHPGDNSSGYQQQFDQSLHLKLHAKPSLRNIEPPPCDTPPALMSPTGIKEELPYDYFQIASQAQPVAMHFGNHAELGRMPSSPEQASFGNVSDPNHHHQQQQQQQQQGVITSTFREPPMLTKKPSLGMRASRLMVEEELFGPGYNAPGNGEYDPTFNLYHDMVMKLVNQDIQNTCMKLGLAQDPNAWNAIQVQTWILETVRQQQLCEPNLENFNMPGHVFASLSANDFQARAPECGDRLYTCLQIWTSARDFSLPAQRQQLQQTFSSQSGLCLPLRTMDDVDDESVAYLAWQQHLPVMGHADLSPCSGSSGSGGEHYDQYDQHQMTPSTSTSMFSDMGDINMAPPQNIYHLPPLNIARGDHNPCGSKSPQGMAMGQIAMLASPQSDSTEDSGVHTDMDETMDLENIHIQMPNAGGSHVHLWQFIRELLEHPECYGHCVRWLHREEGIFKIEDSVKMAKLWGGHKNRPAMNYDKLSRSLRQYYKKGILQKTPRSQRLVYQFCHPYHL